MVNGIEVLVTLFEHHSRLFILLFLCSAILFCSFFIFNQILTTTFIGYSDPAAYGHVAANIVSGRGPVQDFVDFYFEKRATISHRSQHWYSAYTMALIPFILLFGKTSFSIKLFTAGCYIILCLGIFFLVRRLFSFHVSVLTTLSFALNPYVIEYSMNGWPDIPFTLLTFLVLLCYVVSREQEKFYLILPIPLFLLCWFRGAGYLVFAGLIVDLLIQRRKVIIQSKRLLLSLFVILILLILLFFSGSSIPGNQESHLMLAATMGYDENPESEHWQLFWNDPPNLFRKIEKTGLSTLFLKFSREMTALIIQKDYFEKNPPLVALISLPLFLSGLFWLLGNHKKRAATLIMSISFFYLVGLAALFKMNSRYLFPIQILLLASGWQGMLEIIIMLFNRLTKGELFLIKEHSKNIGYYSLIAAFFLLFLISVPPFFEFYTQSGRADSPYPLTDDYYILAAFDETRLFIDKDDNVMCNLPWSYTFHTGRKSVMIPYGNAADMFEIIKRFKIDWFIDFCGKGGFFVNNYPEFVPVHTFKKMTIYRIELNYGSGRGKQYYQHNWRLFEW